MKDRIQIKQIGNHIGEEVILAGWVDVRRDHGKLIFIDLRDASGKVQMVALPNHAEAHALASTVRPEWVLKVVGKVNKRPEKMVNKGVPNGDIELEIFSIEVLNQSETPPFDVTSDGREIGEENRLKYRYLDLRRERMQKNMRLRDQVVTFFRNYMHEHNFIEIETPILMKGTPEGSREYIVPSRLEKGKFYALPQSPQQFKQLCMVAGFERYFQIARCMRDEDLRGDRQPEFTQLDYEMSFVTYAQSLEKYGSDKPDLRKNKEDLNELAFVWIIDFSMFEKDDEGNAQTVHHPFCSVKDEDKPKLMEGKDIYSIRANAYDIVANGFELSSGSIRIHEREMQKRVFDLLGISEQEQQERFGHMLEAFTYGAPPHGGFAPGIDRIVMLLAGEQNIREVIAFPKTGEGRDLMMGSPSAVNPKQLRELGISVNEK